MDKLDLDLSGEWITLPVEPSLSPWIDASILIPLIPAAAG